MLERDGYIPGVPCWVDTNQADPDAAVAFYGGLFGWDLQNVVPDGVTPAYYIASLRGGSVAAIGGLPEGDQSPSAWNTYIWVDSANDVAAKVEAAGGRVISEPFDVPGAGRMAICADPEGAQFRLWQAMGNKGAQIVNEHGSVNFNGLNTRDLDGAKSFYGSVFGWETLEMGGGGLGWRLPGYGEFLAQRDPDLRERMAQSGAPGGFEDVVGTLGTIQDDQGDVPAHWSVTFAVDDADVIAAKAAELGGRVEVPPFDAPWVRLTVITDPQGATFIASKFVPENKDLAFQADGGTGAPA